MGRKGTNNVGGPPGSLKAWLFGLRLPANKHRILELMVEKADPEDGCLWYAEDWFAHWSASSVRNVGRIIKSLETHKQENGEPVLKVWRLHRRASVYQVQCPELPKLHDLARVELMRGVNLGEPDTLPDKLSSNVSPTDCPPVPDNSGPESEGLPDKSGPKGDPNCPTDVYQEELPENNEVDQGKDPPPEAEGGGAPEGPPPHAHPRRNFDHYKDSWNAMVARAVAELARIEAVTESWKRMIRTREREKRFDWAALMERAAQARGVKKSWFNFEFLIKNDRGYAKLLDGNYDEGWGGGQQPEQTRRESTLEGLAGMRR